MPASKSADSIGLELQRFRRRKHLMQEDAARLLGVSQAYISRIESGTSAPSKKLRAKLESLMERPEHWSLIDHVRMMVTKSPHIAALYSERRGKLYYEAFSESIKDHQDIFTVEAIGTESKMDHAPEARALVNDIIEAGGFDGGVAYVESVWSWPPTDKRPEVSHWRTMHSSLRSDEETWLAHTYHMPITLEEKEALIKQWGRNFFIKPFVKDEATAPLDEFR